MGIHSLGKRGIGMKQRRRLTQRQQGRQHAGDFPGADPRGVFDTRLVVGDRQGLAGKLRQALTVGDPGGQQRWRRTHADILQGAAHALLGKTLTDARGVQFDRFQRTHQQHFVELAGPHVGMGKHVEEATHQRA
ncbi:hypothetical protein D3C72_1572670 [compost metagenome]